MNQLASTGLGYVFTQLHDGETQLVTDLFAVAERHRTDHEIHHVARDLAGWSQTNLRQIAAVAADHDITLDADTEHSGRLSRLADKIVERAGRRPEPALLLLDDLRSIYLKASANSLAWEMLAQLAQATRRSDILQLSSDCHPQTLRQIRWANTMIKTLSPQALTSL